MGILKTEEEKLPYMFLFDNSGADPNILFMMRAMDEETDPEYVRNGDQPTASLSDVGGAVKIYIIPSRLSEENTVAMFDHYLERNDRLVF